MFRRARPLLFMAFVAGAALPECAAAERRAPAPQRDELARAVYFESNSTALPPDAVPYLEQWASFLTRRDRESSLRLQGHADARGSPEYNRYLARQRAMAVRRALVEFGVQAARLSVESAGAGSPQAFGRTEFAWSRNRRVELELQP